MNKKFVLFAVASLTLTAAAVAVSAAKNESLRTVPTVDLSRYAGRWYEIARLPNRFEKKCTKDITANYTLQANETLAIVNLCTQENGETIRARGTARLADKNKPNSVLEVRFAPDFLSFLPFVWGDYQIIDLAEDYSYAVVGRQNRKDLWILARAPQLDAQIYDRLIDNAAAQGFDTSSLIKTLHSSF